jgi:hypothetical protein
MAPPQAAADAPGLDVAHPGEERVLPLLRHEFGTVLPVSTASIAGFASTSALQYHCVVSSGSIGTPPRSPCGT